MRLSEWRASPPHRDAAGPKISAVVDPILRALGADSDPHCWIAWGDEPHARHTIFVPTDPGLIATFVRVNVPGEGPRATTKLIRWNRVTIGELAVETQAGHHMLSVQLEQQVLRGVDAEADRIAAFALRIIAAIDGRPLPPVAEDGPRQAGAARAGKTASGAATAGKAASAAAKAGSPAKARRATPSSVGPVHARAGR